MILTFLKTIFESVLTAIIMVIAYALVLIPIIINSIIMGIPSYLIYDFLIRPSIKTNNITYFTFVGVLFIIGIVGFLLKTGASQFVNIKETKDKNK